MPLRDIVISRTRVIPVRLLSVSFSRSGGPGGQNVNKVATKVDLRLDLDGAVEILGEHSVARIREKLASRLDADGNLQVVSSEYREQARNLDAALARMKTLIVDAIRVPRPRRPTRPTRASHQRRIAEKKHRGDIKRGRRRPPDD